MRSSFILFHKKCREFLLEGLTILKNRGYDSMGIATMSGQPSDGLVSAFDPLNHSLMVLDSYHK